MKHNIKYHLYIMFFVLITIITRIAFLSFPQPLYHFTPLAALALFLGLHLKKTHAIVYTLITLLISDLFINIVLLKGVYGIMYSSWYISYVVFACITLIAYLPLQKFNGVVQFFIKTIGASLFHFLITNAIVWFNHGLDIRTMQSLSFDVNGLMQAYLQAIPFMVNFTLSTIFFLAIMLLSVSSIKNFVYNKTQYFKSIA